MLTRWTSHLQDPKEKENFEKEIRGSRLILDRLHQIIVEQEQGLLQAEVSPKNYEIPNWDYKQAHSNGFRQCLGIMKRLTDLNEKEQG